MAKTIKKTFTYLQEKQVIDFAKLNSLDFPQYWSKNSRSFGVAPEKRSFYQQQFGKNKLITPKFSHGKKLWEILVAPFNFLLLMIGIAELSVYFFYQGSDILDLISALVIFFMIILAGSVDYTQDYKAYLSNLKLQHLVTNSFPVFNQQLKSPVIQEIDLPKFRENLILLDQSELVVGDIIYLESGAIVPADVRLIYQKNLSVNQASLTGESNWVTKKLETEKEQLIELENILFAQTEIVQGLAIGVVLNVGENNYASALLKMAETQEVVTDYEKGLTKITKFLVIAILGLIPLILIAVGLRTNEWLHALTFALTVAVSLTPEALPAIISSNLQLGAKKLIKDKVVVKNLSVVQNMGSVNVLCTDKTGTLTDEEIVLNRVQTLKGEETSYLQELLLLNAYYQPKITNKIDQAILKTFDFPQTLVKYHLLADDPFTHEKREASVLLQSKVYPATPLQITKGAALDLLTKCTYYRENDEVQRLTPETQKLLITQVLKAAQEGYRTLGIASQTLTKTFKNENLIFEGIAYFQEKIKNTAQSAIKAINDYHIDLRILTGDAPEIAQQIAQQLEIPKNGLLTGSELTSLSAQSYAAKIHETGIFAKLSPLDKANIVEHLRSEDQAVVAFLGDGVNDALALKSADVGISVNNGTPLAKAAASVILLEKDLGVLENSFVQGRKIFTNAIKYINITVAVNFGLLFSLLISSLWFDFVAMSPLQLLFQNLIYDFANLVFVFDRVDDYSIRQPMRWNAKNIISFALWNGMVATIISLSNFFIVGYGFGLFDQIKSGDQWALSQFQTIFFLESLMTHMVLILVYRTERISFLQSWPSWQLGAGMIFFLGIALMMTYIPTLAAAIKFQKPDPHWYGAFAGLSVGTWLLGEGMKHAYQKVFRHWF